MDHICGVGLGLLRDQALHIFTSFMQLSFHRIAASRPSVSKPFQPSSRIVHISDTLKLETNLLTVRRDRSSIGDPFHYSGSYALEKPTAAVDLIKHRCEIQTPIHSDHQQDDLREREDTGIAANPIDRRSHPDL